MMIKSLFSTIFISFSVLLQPIFAQHETQVNLPDSAIARIGKGGITVMRFLADGTQLAVGTDIGVWIYDVSTGNVKNLLTPHPRGVDNIVLSPDSRILASSGCSSPVIILWDLGTGKKIQILRSHLNASGSALAFSKDGKTLTGLYSNFWTENTYIRWDVATGKRLSIDTGAGVGWPLACTKDNSIFAGVNRDGKIIVFHEDSLKKEGFVSKTMKSVISIFSKSKKKEKHKPAHGIMTVTFSPDNKTIVTGGEDRVLRFWDTATQTEQTTLKGHTAWITAIAFAEDNTTLATGDAGAKIHLWDAHTSKHQATLKAHTHTINTLAFTPDGKKLASGSLDGTIRLWDVNTGRELSIIAKDHIMKTRAVAFSPDSKTCVTSTFIGKIKTWDINARNELNSFTTAPNAIIKVMSLSSDATIFVSIAPPHATGVPARNGFRRERWSARGQNKMRLWDINTGSEISSPLPSDVRPNALTFSPDNKILATTHSFDGIRLWEVSTGQETVNFKVRDKVLKFSPDSAILVSGGDSDETHVWDVNTAKKHTTLTTGRAQTLAFSPDSSIVAIGNRTEIHLWDVNSVQTPSTILTDHLIELKDAEINALTFSPDGKFIVAGLTVGINKTAYGVELWDLEKAERLATYFGHSNEIKTLQFSHDGKVLASGSQDGTVLLWDWDKVVRDVMLENRWPNDK